MKTSNAHTSAYYWAAKNAQTGQDVSSILNLTQKYTISPELFRLFYDA
ncbi:MAG: hypothetical protein Q7J34_00905 [Bacteroidales bacterium]|nr:hypothetical protein [Bacteroidales bacterium]